MEAQQIVGARLKEIRSQLALTQLELADKIGCSRVAYAYYEAGKRPPDINFLFSLKEITGYSFDYLLGNTDNTTLETAGLDRTLGLSTKSLEVLKSNHRASATINRIFQSDTIAKLSGNLSVFNRFTACLHLGMAKGFNEDELEKCDSLTESYFSAAISLLRDIFTARNAKDSYYLEMPTSDSLKAYLDDEIEVDRRMNRIKNPFARAGMHMAMYHEHQQEMNSKSALEDDEAKEVRT